MRRALLILLAVLPIGFASAASAATTKSLSVVRTSDFEVPSAADFTVNADWTTMLGSAADGQVFNCKDGVKNYAGFVDIALGIALRIIGGQQVDMACKPLLKLADKSYTVTGTIASDALGLTDGVFSITCNLKSNLNVVAQVSMGQPVAGFAQIHVTSSDPLPLACSFTGSGKINGEDAGLRGTVEGWAAVGDAASSDCTAGETACIPFSLGNSTKVTVTQATGVLDGYVGSGTYSYADTFNLSTIVNGVNSLRERFPSMFANSVPESTPATMSISLSRGAAKTVILRPAPASALARGVVSPTSPIVVAAPSGASCRLQLKAGSKTWTSSAATARFGSVSFSFKSTDLQRITKSNLKVNLNSKPTVSATVTCRSGLSSLTPTTETLKLSPS